MPDAAHRQFKSRLYAQFARIGKGLASPQRLELLELLAQGDRTVEALAKEAELSVANTSQHLKVLRHSGLVEGRRAGHFMHYRLADLGVFALTAAVRTVAEKRLADLDRLVRDHFTSRVGDESVDLRDLRRAMTSGDVIIVDARPVEEFAAGHIAGAISVPAPNAGVRLPRLARGKQIVAYCRGPYCIYADRVVDRFRRAGLRARRLREGFPEWRAAGFPTEASR